ncbi:MAG: single-stranded-DNA-specific exonuclease RecJ, partial [Coriobacteriales bacterium]|nr:single-stranded-DNA-specific exonuclease RecJ [Coriobacteriales bacterium]
MQDLSTTAKWVSREPKTGLDHQLVEQLAGALGLHRLVARVLIGRGLTDIRQAKAFLDASLDSEEFPAANIAGLSEVAVALVAAINRDSRIMVFGDFDVDGLSATALLYLALKYLGATVSYLIPSRLEEGYGLTEQVLPRILEKNPQTVITVDCGISASKVVDQLVGSGIEVLISDHHEVSETVPTSALVADPKLDPEGFGQHLAGAGVALALVKLLGQSFDCPELWREYTDLAALGTIADMVPLIGLNRALVRDGLERINHRPRPGIQALTCLQPQNGQLTAVNLSFGMIPRLNAPGRLGRPDEAIQILIADHLEQAIILAGRLEDTNILRRKLEAELAGAAMVQAESNYQAGKKLVVVAGEGWHEGIRGIIASRIARQLGVPAIVFSLIDGQARGSGRSVGSVNLYSALDAVSSLTLQYGGHESAVGVTLDPKNLEEFSNLLEAELAKEPPEHFHPPVIVDAQLSLGDLDWDAVQDLALLEPFGQANPQPSFVSQPVSFYNQRVVGSLGNHVSFEVSDHQTELSAIWFSCPDVAGLLARRGLQEIVFEPQAELWRGQRRLQLRVSDSFAVSIDEALVEAFPELVTGLYPSQVEALDLLGAGHSPLCLMPTGRGKSLVFQIHAARQALIGQAVSLFVYPLRALVNDQQQHLVDRLERIGLNSRILCGLNTPEERASVYQAMSDGEVSMVLTTPEYLLLYADRIAKAARIVFIDFDEAHHIAAENALYRPAYNRLQELHQYFPMTQFLATTATADSQTAFQISQALNLDSLVIDDSRRPNLKLIDRRNDPDRLA